MTARLLDAFVTIILALIAAAPAIIYARKALKQGEVNGAIAQETNKKSDTLIESTNTIHKLVNSSTDALKATIVTLQADAVLNTARIAELTSLCTMLQQTVAALHETIEAASVTNVRAV